MIFSDIPRNTDSFIEVIRFSIETNTVPCMKKSDMSASVSHCLPLLSLPLLDNSGNVESVITPCLISHVIRQECTNVLIIATFLCKSSRRTRNVRFEGSKPFRESLVSVFMWREVRGHGGRL